MPTARFEKTLKLTPSAAIVAPSGALLPAPTAVERSDELVGVSGITIRVPPSGPGRHADSATPAVRKSRAYRWGEDGIAGISDDRQRLCFSLALWNGKDAILKELARHPARLLLANGPDIFVTSPLPIGIGESPWRDYSSGIQGNQHQDESIAQHDAGHR